MQQLLSDKDAQMKVIEKQLLEKDKHVDKMLEQGAKQQQMIRQQRELQDHYIQEQTMKAR